jgi:hypothetical protein
MLAPRSAAVTDGRRQVSGDVNERDGVA